MRGECVKIQIDTDATAPRWCPRRLVHIDVERRPKVPGVGHRMLIDLHLLTRLLKCRHFTPRPTGHPDTQSCLGLVAILRAG